MKGVVSRFLDEVVTKSKVWANKLCKGHQNMSDSSSEDSEPVNVHMQRVLRIHFYVNGIQK